MCWVLMVAMVVTQAAHAAPKGWTQVDDPRGTLFEAVGLIGIDMGRVDQLLAAGAEVNVMDRRGFTPMHYATMFGRKDLTQMLHSRGARLSDAHVAAAVGSVKQLLGFLRDGTALDERDAFQATPLHWAALTGEMATMELLVQRGAAVDAVNDRARTPLHNAAFGGHTLAARYLLEHGADLEKADEAGNTVLHLAVMGDRLTTAALLLKHGADAGAENERHETPLSLARKRELTKMTALLEARMAAPVPEPAAKPAPQPGAQADDSASSS